MVLRVGRKGQAAVQLAGAAWASAIMAVASWLLLGDALDPTASLPLRDALLLAVLIGTLFISPVALVLGLTLRAALRHFGRTDLALATGLIAGALTGMAWPLLAAESLAGVLEDPLLVLLSITAGALAGLTYFVLMPPLTLRPN